MKESVTYQAILEEGRAEAAQRNVLSLGTSLLGKPSPKVRRTLGRITDLNVLETLLLSVVKVDSWTELLAHLK